MEAPTLYHFDPLSKAYLGSTAADIDPEETRRAGAPRYCDAANTTRVPPPEPEEGFARCFMGGAWRQIEDHRGKTVYLTVERADADGNVIGSTGEPVTMAELGPLPVDVTPAAPGPYDRWDESHGAWVEDAAIKRTATVPASISPRQMLIGLMNQGIITETEAIAAAQTGAVPAAIGQFFDALPSAAERAAATITWAKMTVVERDHPMVAALAAANGMTESEVDAFFQVCAEL